ncbi:hypothetical protein [Methanosarcina horonobensis]|uniref:hypothetical protein n=1 Tax=Methanosarcina horonobensis TaxID=418008 RepID=UPI0022B8CD92|nr:hypothetical protein [Methanosarcina horonobensis]
MKKTACKSEVRGLFQESRSDGIGIFLISQRPQRVDKTCLSQCTNYFIGRLTSQRDQQAVNNYIDRTKMTKELRDFESGEFYIDGIKRDPEIVKIREAKTVHSGNSPKNILTENKVDFYKNTKKINSRKKNMENPIKEVEKVLPDTKSFSHLAGIGIDFALGSAVSGIAGNFVGSKVAIPVAFVSGRTVGSLATTLAMYAGYKVSPYGKDVLMYGTAGSAAYTVGSVAFDILKLTNVNMSALDFIIQTATGAQKQ